MIIFGSTLSPFVRKTAAFLREKGLDFDLKPTGIPNPSPEFCAASPFRKMPAFQDNDYCLADSSAICHYIDAKYPEPQLIPAEPRARGKVVWFDEFSDTIMAACGAKMFFNRVVAPVFLKRDGDPAVADAAECDELPPLLDYLEGQIPASGFLVEDRLTLADIAVAGPFANLAHSGVAIDPARYPKISAYAAAILSRPSFAAAVSRETAFLQKVAAQ